MEIFFVVGRGAASIMQTGYTAGVGDFQRVGGHEQPVYTDRHRYPTRVVRTSLNTVDWYIDANLFINAPTGSSSMRACTLI
jgi:hypothetical protein